MKNCTFLLVLLFSILIQTAHANEYQIFSISQDLPMGHKNEVIKKNYYINIGSTQGISKGTVLDVFRNLSVVDIYNSEKRAHFNVKIATIKIIHTENSVAIAQMESFTAQSENLYLDVESIMIGDRVAVSVK